MRKSSVLLAIVAVACAFSAGLSWWQLRAERAKVAELEEQLSAIPAPRNEPAAPPPPALAQATSPSPTSSAPQPTTDAAANPEAASQEEISDQLRAAQKREREMMRDPAYRQANIEGWRRNHARTRADAIRVMGLTAEQADRFIDLLVDRNLRAMDVFDYPGQRPNEQQRAALALLDEGQQARLRVLLGEQKYERWQWYQASAGARGEVSQFREQLSTTAEPLKDGQADALVEALHAERERRDREYEDYATSAGITDRFNVALPDRQHWIELEKASNQRIHDAVSNTLTRSQLESLDKMLAANVAPAEAALRLQLQGNLSKSN